MKYVIIGNGIAGICGAETIRQYDPKASITMIADEAFPPYCRPMISMVLEGSIPLSKLPIRNSSFYDDMNITSILGSRVTGIDTDNKFVIMPDKNSGKKQIPFDKLLIATGADPRPIKAEGLDLKNIFYMRTQAHVKNMINILPHAKNALVLGGGLVGFKAAYGLLNQGINVTMLISSKYPLSMQVDETAGKMIMDELICHGLNVKIGVHVTQFHGNKVLQNASLSDGTKLVCDMAVIGKGVLPSLSFIPKDKIKVDLGIMVNSYMETSIPGIFAAGDVAQYIDIARKESWVNAIWPEAVSQGCIAGMNMAGLELPYKGSLSRNVIRIFNMDIMTGGIVNPSDNAYEIISKIDLRKKTYRKLVFKKNQLVGMVMVNNIEQGGLLISMIQNQIPVTINREKFLDSSFNYRTLL